MGSHRTAQQAELLPTAVRLLTVLQRLTVPSCLPSHLSCCSERRACCIARHLCYDTRSYSRRTEMGGAAALQEAARAAVAEAAKDKAEAVSACVQQELDAAELRERLGRYERTQVRRRGGRGRAPWSRLVWSVECMPARIQGPGAAHSRRVAVLQPPTALSPEACLSALAHGELACTLLSGQNEVCTHGALAPRERFSAGWRSRSLGAGGAGAQPGGAEPIG